MRNVGIIADSTCDLSVDLLEKYQVHILPLHIHLGEKEYSDGVDITLEQIYAWSDTNKATPKTSAMSPLEAEECLKEHLAAYEEVICFCISETMSSSAEIMRMTSINLGVGKRVFVIDSQNLSTGIGLQVIEAAIMADKGKSAREIAESIARMQPFVRTSFVIDTLTYLHRGGRCTGIAAMAGTTLKLHPCILVIDGKMKAGKKYRGRMEKVITAYVSDLIPSLKTARKERVFITHSGCDNQIIDRVRKQLEELKCFDEILITRAGSVVASHCGPGTLGVLFVEDEGGKK